VTLGKCGRGAPPGSILAGALDAGGFCARYAGMANITVQVGNLRKDPKDGKVYVDAQPRDITDKIYSVFQIVLTRDTNGIIEPAIISFENPDHVPITSPQLLGRVREFVRNQKAAVDAKFTE
jgi:hypothetical protein